MPKSLQPEGVDLRSMTLDCKEVLENQGLWQKKYQGTFTRKYQDTFTRNIEAGLQGNIKARL